MNFFPRITVEHENTMGTVNFNKTRAAELLKIDRKTLYNKIKSYEDLQQQDIN